MARKKKFDYFQAFVQITGYAVEYAEQLTAYIEKNVAIAGEGREPDVEYARQRYEELHTIETKADSVKHDIITALGTEFIAPLEREDIIELADELDDLVDELDEILQRMYMYDVHIVPPLVLELMQLAEQAVRAINDLSVEFVNFKKADTIRPLVIKVNDIEDQADRVYIHAMHDVYAHARQTNSLDALGIGQILTEIERICDTCEGISDSIAAVCLKNS